MKIHYIALISLCSLSTIAMEKVLYPKNAEKVAPIKETAAKTGNHAVAHNTATNAAAGVAHVNLNAKRKYQREIIYIGGRYGKTDK